MSDEEPTRPGLAHGIGAAVLAALGGMATFADDCARVGSHVGSVGDDIGRVATHADDLGHAVVATEGAAHVGDDLGRVATHLDDATRVSDDLARDLAELGLDAGDLALDVADLASGDGATEGTPSAPARPRLVEAGKPNPPADGPVNPLVLLVTDDDLARIERLARGCTTIEHQCLVLACAPSASNACRDGWRATWKELGKDPALVGHPEAVADALLLAGTSRRETVATRSARGTFTAMGIQIERR